MKYLISQTSATGEGITICLMVTSESMRDEIADDYFLGFFDYYYANFREFVTKEQFLEYKNYIPEIVQKHINGEVSPAPYFIWHSRFHVNYS